MDVDGSGVLDWNEFLALLRNANHDIQQLSDTICGMDATTVRVVLDHSQYAEFVEQWIRKVGRFEASAAGPRDVVPKDSEVPKGDNAGMGAVSTRSRASFQKELMSVSGCA